MRILLLTGGLYILAAIPMAAQEATDSTTVFAVPAATPAAPNLQELFVGAADSVSGVLSGSGAIGIAGAALIGLGLGLVLRSGGSQPAGGFRGT